MVHGCTCPELCSVHWSRRSAEKKVALKKGNVEKPAKKTKKKEVEPEPEYNTSEEQV